ncbi:hypothetical protein D9756_004143 [Leucocoprinus leucothites]|uniref:Protein kinase domain-containing protein n=1 Tax=Leucocoprinus leucothites TaxID=201217 RepID=A0A8H5DBI4_9AGAR|nr:hypothetical protein D9756_004143 [Leucoagaricus leucothites]
MTEEERGRPRARKVFDEHWGQTRGRILVVTGVSDSDSSGDSDDDYIVADGDSGSFSYQGHSDSLNSSHSGLRGPQAHPSTIPASSLESPQHRNTWSVLSSSNAILSDEESPQSLSTPAAPLSLDEFASSSSTNSQVVRERVLVIVTSDLERFLTLDVGGAPDSAYIKKGIFTKLHIFTAEEQAHYSVFRIELDPKGHDLGEALSDEALFMLCRDYGDSKGSLKFFIRNTHPPSLSPTTSIPSATHPRSTSRKLRSRHGSASSTRNEMPREVAAGYDADLDSFEHNLQRSASSLSRGGMIHNPRKRRSMSRHSLSSAVGEQSYEPGNGYEADLDDRGRAFIARVHGLHEGPAEIVAIHLPRPKFIRTSELIALRANLPNICNQKWVYDNLFDTSISHDTHISNPFSRLSETEQFTDTAPNSWEDPTTQDDILLDSVATVPDKSALSLGIRADGTTNTSPSDGKDKARIRHNLSSDEDEQRTQLLASQTEGSRGVTDVPPLSILSLDQNSPSLSAMPESIQAGHDLIPGERCQISDHLLARTLLLDILDQAKSMGRLFTPDLSQEEAQCVLDFLSKVCPQLNSVTVAKISKKQTKLLNERTGFKANETKRILSLVSMLAKSAQVFPAGCELKEVQCDLTKPFNEGGFGYVCQGTYKSHIVCVKAVRLYRQQDNMRNLRTQAKELALMAHLTHPNILPFYGVYLSDPEIPRICIVAKWMDKGDLNYFLDKFPDTPRMPLLSDVIDGLQYLHDFGIIHADLKAGNVLVSDSGHAVIADFGISHIASSLSTSTQISNGTPRWTAPELVIDETARPTPQSDIWSYACLCYEVLTGEVPFAQYSKTYQLCMAIAKGSITPLTLASAEVACRIDPRVRCFLEGCWRYNPQERSTSEDVMHFFRNLDILDIRPPAINDDPVLQEVQKVRSEVEVDYDCVARVLERILESGAEGKGTSEDVAGGL